MQPRHEYKHIITFSDMTVLRQRLPSVMKRDINSVDGKYKIRSLYFDDIRDTALKEKINGINVREKFRLRYYNGDLSYICLEKKSKVNGLCLKESVNLSKEQVGDILDGKISWMLKSEEPLLKELYSKMLSKGLRPKTIVDYEREAFVFSAGNVRVTLDYNIRTGLINRDFLNPDSVTIPVPQNPIVLEVKWDEFLPDTIKSVIRLPMSRTTAFSKYAACRLYD